MFKGYIKFHTKELELQAWELVKSLCDEALKKYETSLEDDLALLEKDDKEQCLTSNERNCVLYRKGEKKILHYLLDTADKVNHVFSMTQKEARKEINSYPNFEGSMEYFKGTLIPQLLNN